MGRHLIDSNLPACQHYSLSSKLMNDCFAFDPVGARLVDKVQDAFNYYEIRVAPWYRHPVEADVVGGSGARMSR